MGERVAVIDLGTNTFHLVVAELQEEQFQILYRERTAVKLGQAGISQGFIAEDAQIRAVKTLLNFKKTIASLEVKKVKAFATSAIRNASNGRAFVALVKEETGIDIEVISGAQEAEYIYYGVRSAMELDPQPSLIMDIGGGSVEFIIGNDHDILWKRSFEIGAQRLLDQFHHIDPIPKEEINKLNRYFDEMLPKLFEALEEYQPEILIGSSGTFDTLSDIYQHENHIIIDEKGSETPLTLEGFSAIYDEIIHYDREQRLAMHGMVDFRVDMIVVSCVLVNYVLNRYGNFRKIRVSTHALKEGVLYSLNRVLNEN